MSTTTFAEFYSIVSTSLQRKLLYHWTTILTSIFFNFIKNLGLPIPKIILIISKSKAHSITSSFPLKKNFFYNPIHSIICSNTSNVLSKVISTA